MLLLGVDEVFSWSLLRLKSALRDLGFLVGWFEGISPAKEGLSPDWNSLEDRENRCVECVVGVVTGVVGGVGSVMT